MKMNKKEIFRFIKFTLFSASAGIIQIGSFALLQLIFKDGEYGWSYFISLFLSVLWNFTFNFKFTFKAATNIPKAMALAFLFYVFFTPLSTLGGDYLVTTCGWNDFLVLAISMILNFVLEFFWNRYVVYGKKVDTRVVEKTQNKEEAEVNTENNGNN